MITTKHGSPRQMIVQFATILHEIWAPPSSASFEHLPLHLAPGLGECRSSYVILCENTSCLWLLPALCLLSPLAPSLQPAAALRHRWEAICDQRGASLGELFLNPLRESPRVLWCSGFKAQESLHLMWNIQPAGIISQSVHLLPHAAMPVASYLALLWCLPH